MSIDEQNAVKKAMRNENLIRDTVKGSFGVVAIWILWGAYSEQTKNTLKEVDSLKGQVVNLTERVIQCNQDGKQKLENSIYRIEGYIIENSKK